MKNKQRGRQRQRMRQRIAWLIAGSFIVAASIVTTIVIHSLRIDRSRANEKKSNSLRLMEEQEYVTDFSIDAPVVKPENANDPQVTCFQKIKPDPNNSK